MKYKAIVFFTTLLIFSFTLEESHPFEKVVMSQKDKKTKKKLQAFKQGGIEMSLVFKNFKEGNDTLIGDSVIDLEKIISKAESFIGTKHRMGGTSKKGIDCSGMVMESLKSCGIMTPHNSHGQARYGRIIPEMDSLKRGDLVFYINSFKSPYLITHSGICLGDGKFIHASASCGVVITALTAPYWKSRFIFGTRLKI